MALIELTTEARVKAVLAIDPTDTTEDAWIATAIQHVSQRMELHMDRPVEIVERTEEYDIHDGRQKSLFLRSYPVTAIASVKNDTAWDWASTTAIDAENYHVDGPNGMLHLAIELAAGPKSVQVVYTGGLAADTAGVISDHPALAGAADLQIAAMFRRRSTPQGDSVQGKEGGAVTFEQPLKLIPEVMQTLHSYRRFRFGI